MLKLMTLDDYSIKKAIGLAVICWNLAILPEDEREKIQNDLMNEVFPKQIIGMLMERKKTYFADIKRLIMEYEVIPSKNDCRINVVSTPQRD